MATEEHGSGLADPPDGSVRGQAAVRRRTRSNGTPPPTSPSGWRIAVLAMVALLVLSTRRRAIVPSRGQSVAELFYGFIHKMVEDVAGPRRPEVLPLRHDPLHVRLPVEHAGPDPDVLHHHLAHRGHGGPGAAGVPDRHARRLLPQGHRLPVDVLGLLGAAGPAPDPGA